MEVLKLFCVTFLLLLCYSPGYFANTYNVGDRVPLFVNKIGPLHNPSETYQYYELGFCHPDKMLDKKESLGELLNGDSFRSSSYELGFLVNRTRATLCNQKLNRNSVDKFRNAIAHDFYYQMHFDDLPLWAFIGKIGSESLVKNSKSQKYLLFTHVRFDVLYNGNQVIEIRAFSDPSHVVDVTENAAIDVKFTYSVFWEKTSTPYINRMNRYWKTASLPILQHIHWFSFVNSIGIAVLLIGLLTVVYMRHLKYDLRKWQIGDEEEEKDVGWKYIHGDVLRCPAKLVLLSAFLGSGTQLLSLIFILFILAFLGVLYPFNHGVLLNTIVISYILSSAIAGHCSSSFCSQYSETEWKKSVFMAGFIFLGPVIAMKFALNILAVYFGVNAALPLGTILVLLLLCIFVAVPLIFLGGVVGNRYKSELQSSSIPKKSPREIPSLVWYRKTPAQMFIGGLLPFSAVILEFHNLYSTIWGHKIYAVPCILFITFAVLIFLTALMSIGLTYFQLAVEDHEWCWRSVLRGGSTAIFMFAYCIYFYFKSNMSGMWQSSFFFGYSLLMCFAFFLMLGTVGFQASYMFVKRIYRTVKSE